MSESIDKARAIREGEELAVEPLLAYLKDNVEGFESIDEVEQFPSGYSNLTYLLKTNLGEMVLRRPPFGAKIKSAHDMGREFRVLSMLRPHYPKVPEPIIHCENEEVIGAPFYVMERVKGVILRNKVPKGIDMTVDLIRKVSEVTVDNLVDLHAIDIEATGLIDMGKPAGYVQRQVEGWIKRYYNAETDKIEGMDFLAEWMPKNMPEEITPSFIHNDYKYDNVVLNPDNPGEITAVLDWEMATVGDPLMDLATTLAYWAEETDADFLKMFSLTSMKGNYTRQEVLERYAEKSGRDVRNFVFYYAYASFKVGVIGQQIYKRFKQGLTKDPRFAGLIYLVQACGQNGQQAVKLNRISNLN